MSWGRWSLDALDSSILDCSRLTLLYSQLPRSNKKCPHCGDMEAVFFQSQQRSADTGMVRLLLESTPSFLLTSAEIVLCLLLLRHHIPMSHYGEMRNEDYFDLKSVALRVSGSIKNIELSKIYCSSMYHQMEWILCPCLAPCFVKR